MATTQNYYKIKHGLEAPSQDAIQLTDNTGPTIRPSLSLDFAKTKTLDPRITFTRASTATYYDGKTTAKAEENLLLYSQEFDNGYWGKLRLSASANTTATTDPLGTNFADKIVEDSTASAFRYIGLVGVPMTAGTYTFSFYAKAAERSIFGVDFNDGAVTAVTYFDLGNGNVPLSSSLHTASIVSVGNGWYRCSITRTYTSNVSGAQYIIFPTVAAGVTAYTGTGTSGFYMWGAQLEQRSRATAYTPTTTAAITNYVPVLQTAASGVARFDHDPVTGESKGLLIEEQRTNSQIYSSDFTTASWTTLNATVTSDTIIAPDGTLTSDKLIPNTSDIYHLTIGPGVNGSGSYTMSVFAKAAGYPRIAVRESGVVGNGAMFDLSTGTVVSTQSAVATITPVGNGWYKCTATVAWGTAYSLGIAVARSTDTSLLPYFAGNGFDGVYIWGAQLEAGAFATSYIPTTLTYTGRGSTATFRGANNLIQTAAANVARYEPNASGGSNLLLESAATNLLTHTNNLYGNWYADGGVNVTVARNATLAPDGSTTAALVRRADAGGTFSNWGQFTQAILVSAGYPNANTLTGSIWLRSATGSNVNISLTLSDVSYQTRTLTVTVTPDWQRFSFTVASGTFNASATYIGFGFNFNSNNQSVYAWGAQLEAGSTLTSLIPSVDANTGRASVATYYDSTGILRTAPSGQPRYTYNPSLLTAPSKLLLEAQATNILTYSDQLENGIWNHYNVTQTANVVTGPDGLTSADRIIASTVNTGHGLTQGVTITNGLTYTASVYAKTLGGYNLFITFGNAPYIEARFDLNAGVVNQNNGLSASIVNVGNGWYRCSLTVTSQNHNQIYFELSDPSNINGFAGNGTSGIYLWGGQLELGYAASSYISTPSGATVTRAADTSTSVAQTRAADVYSSAAVTRSADAASITGTNFSSWYNQSQGTLYADGVMPPNPNGRVVQIGETDMSYFRMIGIVSDGSAANLLASVYKDPVFTNIGITPYTKSTPFKGAVAYAVGNSAVSFNGQTPVASNVTNNLSTSMTTLGIGQGGGVYNNGTIKKIAYYPKRLSNAELANLTS